MKRRKGGEEKPRNKLWSGRWMGRNPTNESLKFDQLQVIKKKWPQWAMQIAVNYPDKVSQIRNFHPPHWTDTFITIHHPEGYFWVARLQNNSLQIEQSIDYFRSSISVPVLAVWLNESTLCCSQKQELPHSHSEECSANSMSHQSPS